jgi:hypothetical protein
MARTDRSTEVPSCDARRVRPQRRSEGSRCRDVHRAVVSRFLAAAPMRIRFEVRKMTLAPLRNGAIRAARDSPAEPSLSRGAAAGSTSPYATLNTARTTASRRNRIEAFGGKGAL